MSMQCPFTDTEHGLGYVKTKNILSFFTDSFKTGRVVQYKAAPMTFTGI